MTDLTIRTNHVPRLIIDDYELSAEERSEFDYMDWDAIERGEDSASFFRYRGTLYDLGDIPLAPDSLRLLGWDRFASDSFFSGIAVRYADDDHVVVALVMS